MANCFLVAASKDFTKPKCDTFLLSTVFFTAASPGGGEAAWAIIQRYLCTKYIGNKCTCFYIIHSYDCHTVCGVIDGIGTTVCEHRFAAVTGDE